MTSEHLFLYWHALLNVQNGEQAQIHARLHSDDADDWPCAAPVSYTDSVVQWLNVT